MDADDNSKDKPNYFLDDRKLTVDGGEAEDIHFMKRSYVLAPLILITCILVGSVVLLSYLNTKF